ncbi:MAG: transposase [Candidatus Sulfotelmatobacter sp.]
MAIPSRHSDSIHAAAGARTFFVTSSISEKRNLLQSNRAAELFMRVLYDYREQRKFRLHEFVVMPDHFHLLLTVGSELTIERAVQFIKGGFAFRAGAWVSIAGLAKGILGSSRSRCGSVSANRRVHPEQSGGEASR